MENLMRKRSQGAVLQSTSALLLLLMTALLSPPVRAENRPWPEGEKLVFEIFWPSGVSMGEATLEAKSIKDNLYFWAVAEVGLPQGRILYKYSSIASSDLCSREYRQSVERPGKFWEEITKFDADAGKATVSRDGRSREVTAAKCSRDPLALLYYYRAQAGVGKSASSETLFLGAPLSLKIEAKGKEQIKIKQTQRRGDHYIIMYPSASGDRSLELWLSDSPAQTPIAVRLPLPLATFSAELRGQ
jgi:hypothetical protein